MSQSDAAGRAGNLIRALPLASCGPWASYPCRGLSFPPEQWGDDSACVCKDQEGTEHGAQTVPPTEVFWGPVSSRSCLWAEGGESGVEERALRSGGVRQGPSQPGPQSGHQIQRSRCSRL